MTLISNVLNIEKRTNKEFVSSYLHNQTYAKRMRFSTPKINQKVRIKTYRYNQQPTQLLGEGDRNLIFRPPVIIIIIIREITFRSHNRGPTKEPTKNFIIL